jgi:hypothetical protein
MDAGYGPELHRVTRTIYVGHFPLIINYLANPLIANRFYPSGFGGSVTCRPTEPRSRHPLRVAGFVFGRGHCSWHRNTGRSGALPVWTLGAADPSKPPSPQPIPGFANPVTVRKSPGGVFVWAPRQP